MADGSYSDWLKQYRKSLTGLIRIYQAISVGMNEGRIVIFEDMIVLVSLSMLSPQEAYLVKHQDESFDLVCLLSFPHRSSVSFSQEALLLVRSVTASSRSAFRTSKRSAC